MQYLLKSQGDANRNHKYVISDCNFTYQGYCMLMHARDIRTSRIFFKSDALIKSYDNDFLSNNDEVVVFVGRDMVSLLESIKKISLLLNTLTEFRFITVYGSMQYGWFCSTLKGLVNDKSKLAMLRLASLSGLCRDIKGEQRLAEEALSNFDNTKIKGLTKREFDVILNCYREITITKQCEMLGLVNKTVYIHRRSALRKLHTIKPWVSDSHILGVVASNRLTNEKMKYSLIEMEVNNAILNDEIFPVYQAITDENKRLVGFEILVRWKRNGEIVMPGCFLPRVNNSSIWVKITALVIFAAISAINKYNGRFYFSVNIPPKLLAGESLIRMAKKATELLLKPQWIENLVLEFPEAIDVAKNDSISSAMKDLKNIGCKVYLDDCFSDNQSILPIRQVDFDGLKLDKDITDGFITNDNDRNIIKSILFYSHITGSDCIAEGVDTNEKFDKLKGLGVRRFQGYYLFHEVGVKEIDKVVGILK